MEVAEMNAEVKQDEAWHALRQYKEHRNTHDARDWEIERIYRAIAKGRKVISVNAAIQNAGLDAQKRPLLAICRADFQWCVHSCNLNELVFGGRNGQWGRTYAEIKVPFPGAEWRSSHQAIVPRIPPQYRPEKSTLKNYNIL